MILRWLFDRADGRSHWSKLIIGSALSALTVSLGSVVVTRALGMEVSSGVHAALAAAAAAAYAKNLHVSESRGRSRDDRDRNRHTAD